MSIVYNPYSLDALSQGVRAVTDYAKCMSERTDCKMSNTPGGLPDLLSQGVDPIVVWARCKSNYALKTWDEGAGAQFSAGRQPATDWAMRVSPEFLSCMRDHYDASICLTLYHSTVHGTTPSAYFLYTDKFDTQNEPPDACLVFSGLRRKAESHLAEVLDACATSDQCDLNPLGPQNKIAASAVHGVVPDAGGVLLDYNVMLTAAAAAAARCRCSTLPLHHVSPSCSTFHLAAALAAARFN